MDIRVPPYSVVITENRDGEWSWTWPNGTGGAGWFATAELALAASQLARGQK